MSHTKMVQNQMTNLDNYNYLVLTYLNKHIHKT